MNIRYNGNSVIGLGQAEAVVAPAATTSPWAVAIATSVLGATTGWVLESISKKERRKRRR